MLVRREDILKPTKRTRVHVKIMTVNWKSMNLNIVLIYNFRLLHLRTGLHNSAVGGGQCVERSISFGLKSCL
jgi:hypothetical protein